MIEVTGECNRQIGGDQLYARLRIRTEPTTHEGPPIVAGYVPPEEFERGNSWRPHRKNFRRWAKEGE